MKLVEPILAFQTELQAIRRDLHAHPELCYEEVRTADMVAERLTAWGIPIVRGRAFDSRDRDGGPAWSASSGTARPSAPSACAPTWMRCRCRS